MYEVPEKKTVSINFSCVMFSLLDFLTPVDGTDKSSQNIGKELQLYAV